MDCLAARADGFFVHTDANGTVAIPLANRTATSGLIKVTKLSLDSSMSAEVDARFGLQGDSLKGTFTATRCTVDRLAFVNGAVGKSFTLPADATRPPARTALAANTTYFWHSYNIDRMIAAGIPVKWKDDTWNQDMHQKSVVLKGRGMAIFGSSNWTSSSSDIQREHNKTLDRADGEVRMAVGDRVVAGTTIVSLRYPDNE